MHTFLGLIAINDAPVGMREPTKRAFPEELALLWGEPKIHATLQGESWGQLYVIAGALDGPTVLEGGHHAGGRRRLK
jgi:hypothetical protein